MLQIVIQLKIPSSQVAQYVQTLSNWGYPQIYVYDAQVTLVVTSRMKHA